MIQYIVRQKQRIQLFDLQKDPGEQHDLSTDPIATRELARLTRLLAKWQGDVGDKTV